MKRTPVDRFVHLLRKRRRRIVGLMSGTSADGLDLAVVDIENRRAGPVFSILAAGTSPYPAALRRKIHELIDAPSCAWEDLVRLHYRWSAFAAERVQVFLHAQRIPRQSIDALASHGQTLAHHPTTKRFLGGPSRGTFQIGDLSVLAHLTGYVTVGDFRWADIAGGGEGAPLSGYYHHLMFSRLHRRGRLPPAVLNIGGIANISVVRMTRGKLGITAFDTGPGNCLSDGVMRLWTRKPYDHEGKLAANGTIQPEILRRMAGHPYFRRRPPKSCGREEFGLSFLRRFYPRPPRSTAELADRLGTVDELAAQAIAQSRRRLGEIGGIIVVGGGLHNRHLMARIAELVSPTPVIGSDSLGLPGDFVEAIGFALLALETLSGRPGNLGGATGAEPAILGKICLPA